MSYELHCCEHPVEKHRRDFEQSVVWCEECDNQAGGGCYEAPRASGHRPREALALEEEASAKG